MKCKKCGCMLNRRSGKKDYKCTLISCGEEYFERDLKESTTKQQYRGWRHG